MFSTTESLNGWWDILPVYGEISDIPKLPPVSGWEEQAYLVPSTWNVNTEAVRKKGEKHFKPCKIEDLPKQEAELEQYEFLFDNFGYPKRWTLASSVWARRSFDFKPSATPETVILHFNGVLARAVLFVNGQRCSEHHDPFLPWEIDIANIVQPGKNHLALFITGYECNANGKTLHPSGNHFTVHGRGVWQDVSLIRKPQLHLMGIGIRSCVEAHQLEVEWEIQNATSQDRITEVQPLLLQWQKNGKYKELYKLPSFGLSIPSGQTITVNKTYDDIDLPRWSPAEPNLCLLRTDLFGGETRDERFGFREITIKGSHLLLNGTPIHLFSDWGHKFTQLCHHEQWIRQWFQTMKDGNLNHSRLHTHPHPELIMNLADEEGILITGETAIFGSGGSLASDDERFWYNAADHIRNFVRRDRNHPSVVLWSVENEMRFNADQTNLFLSRLPEMRQLFHKLDPSRPIYHEGDSSLWFEGDQELISRHYGKECSGMGWWNRQQPLHSGEMSFYHYSGPNNTVMLGGDAVWADFRRVDESAALDTRYIIEDGRTLGVCCFGPWNMSCLMNYRANDREIILHYDDFTTPGIKPLKVPAYCSEFAFWEKQTENAYRPGPGFDIQREAFRPFALIDTNRRRGYFSGQKLKRTIHCVNDLPKTINGVLMARLTEEDHEIWQEKFQLQVEAGQVTPITIDRELPVIDSSRQFKFEYWFEAEGKTLDRQQIRLHISPWEKLSSGEITGPVKVLGMGKYRSIWEKLNLPVTYIDELSKESLRDTRMLIVEPYFFCDEHTNANEILKEFCNRGGRCLLMEQSFSIFPSIPLVTLPLQKVHIRCHHHPALHEIDAAELEFWGNSPYSMVDNDAIVSERSYRKTNGDAFQTIIDGGDGNFGKGDMENVQLLQAPCGTGVILATQLRLENAIHSIPAANRILINMLRYLNDYQPRKHCQLKNSGTIRKLIAAASAGETVWLTCHNFAELEELNAAAGTSLSLIISEEPVFQAVKALPDHPLLEGINNEDGCGIIQWTYGSEKITIPIGNLFFRPTQELEPLLITPTTSCLREMFVLAGRTEALRSHCRSRFLFAEKPEELVVCGRLKVGHGMVILWQFQPESQLPRFDRLKNTLAYNLGTEFNGNILEGTIQPQVQGKGYPEAVMVCENMPEHEVIQKMILATNYTTERMENRAIFSYGSWRKECTPDGVIKAKSSEPQLLFFFLCSDMEHKEFDIDLHVPNPEAMTFLELEGRGKVTFYLNAEKHREIVLTETIADIGDIYLKKGVNNVLLYWQAEAPGTPLKIRWRNIMHKPELGFQFIV